MNKLFIRNATIDDLDAVYNIEAQCFPKAEAATYKALKERLATFPESFFVAELSGNKIGRASCRKRV